MVNDCTILTVLLIYNGIVVASNDPAFFICVPINSSLFTLCRSGWGWFLVQYILEINKHTKWIQLYMWYQHFVDFPHHISVFSKFSYSIAVLGTSSTSPWILSLKSIDYFGTSEYFRGKKRRIFKTSAKLQWRGWLVGVVNFLCSKFDEDAVFFFWR